jgi:secernin
MLSCDTFAIGKKCFSTGKNFFAKNSDRPLGESQPISFVHGGAHAPGETVRCTHLTIPQVSKTYTVLGSKPYWIWGFEMGVNECGLIIGNEAEGSRCDAETEEGLLGMDLLRLALERADTARKGIDVITGLLEQYGQNANASPLFDRRYENSFLLADKDEIWILETAGRQWVAKKVEDWAAISNCYSIGADFDLCSAELEAYARQRRWLHPDEPLDFAKAYTLPAIRQSQSTPRWRRLCRLIEESKKPMDIDSVKAILRDHFEGEIIEPRWGGAYGGFVSVCMHAMTWDAPQTAASLLSSWDDLLGPVSWYSASVPCCSVFIPIYWTGDIPECMKNAGEFYDENSLWWETERLAMLVSADEDRYGQQTRLALQQLEAEIYAQTHTVEGKARLLIQKGEKDEAISTLQRLTSLCAETVMQRVKALAGQISAELENIGGLYGPRKEFLEAYAKRTNLKF